MKTGVSPATVWVTIVVAGLATYSIRLSFLALVGRVRQIPPIAGRALALVPPAVLAALAVPALVIRDGGLDPWNARLAAGAVAAVVAWRSRNVLFTLLAGMGVLWLLQAV